MPIFTRVYFKATMKVCGCAVYPAQVYILKQQNMHINCASKITM